jgi:hypothetical protein
MGSSVAASLFLIAAMMSRSICRMSSTTSDALVELVIHFAAAGRIFAVQGIKLPRDWQSELRVPLRVLCVLCGLEFRLLRLRHKVNRKARKGLRKEPQRKTGTEA